MSAIGWLNGNLTQLPDIILKYETDLNEYDQHLTIKGKTLEYALKEQPTWSAYYGQRAVELSTLVKYLESQVKRVRGVLTVQYNENYNPALSERMTDKYIDRENEYLSIYELYLEVKELLDKYEMILEAFNRRGFALRDITAAKINSVHLDTL